jgi:hypothetical protein
MNFEVRLKGRTAAGALVVCVVAACVLLARQVLFNFIVFSLSDSRSSVSTGALEAATGYFPSSARLNARLAEAQISDPSRDLALADQEIEEAALLSPYDYRLRVVKASVKESRQDLIGAEKALREAASLAPSNNDVRWRLANLLLRAGKVGEALVEFRAVVAGDQSLMPMTLDLVWNVTGGDLRSLRSVAPATVGASMSLASFLLKRGETTEAARVFEGIDREARLAAPASADFINSMIDGGEVGLARRLWTNLVWSGADAAADGPDSPIVWNGGFELDPIPGLAQFDWNLRKSNYAVIGIDTGSSHQGSRSLRIDFEGRDTTRLDGEIEQRIALHRGGHYRFEYYVKTLDLVTTEGPRLALRCDGDPAWTAAGAAIAAGAGDWRKVELDFVAPMGGGSTAPSRKPPFHSETNLMDISRAQGVGGEAARSGLQQPRDMIVVKVKLIRVPRFSYDEPMRGTIWLDDFKIVEIS